MIGMNDIPLTVDRAAPFTSSTASLREIAQALSAAWDLDTTLDLIARRTAQVMQVDSCSIYLIDVDGERLILRASTRLARSSLGRALLHLGDGLTGWAAQYGQPVAVRDAQADPRFKFLPETRERELHSLLAVPLVNRERVIGAMNVQTIDYHDFSADEVEFVSLIGDLAAGALDRASLYDQMQRQIAELTTLAKVSETVTSPLYLDEMLDLVVEMAAKVMNAPVCSLRLNDDTRGELVVQSNNARPAFWSKSMLISNAPIAEQVAQARKPVMIDQLPPTAPGRASEMVQHLGLVAMLAMPLIVREKAIGMLSCYIDQHRAFNVGRDCLVFHASQSDGARHRERTLGDQCRRRARDAPSYQE